MKKSQPEIETEEIFEDYMTDYRDKAAGQRYFPIVGYIGIILAILLGAIIIGLSIIFSSGKVPVLGFLNSNSINLNANTNSGVDPNAVVNIAISPDYPMLGSKDAPVTLIEFADFQCPFCKEFQDQTFAQIKSKYIDTGIAKFYFIDFPFLGAESDSSGIAAECARQQDKFWAYHDLLYKNQGSENSGAFSDLILKKLAKQAGLNTTTFASCQKDSKTADTITQQFQAGKDAGVQATPTIFINGKKIEGVNPFADYQTAIELARKGK